MLEIVQIIIGVALLILGRRLFWLFVGAVGFWIGFNLATQIFSTDSQVVILLLSLLAGVIGALLAVFLQRLSVSVAGFLAGGYTTVILVRQLGMSGGDFAWVPFVLGGLLGAILLAVLFDWALIALSSLAGAVLIAQALQPAEGPGLNMVLFVILLLVGLLIQAGLRRRAEPLEQD